MAPKAIAFELKLTVIVAIYALYKLLHDSGLMYALPSWRDYEIFTLMNRVAYVLGHVGLYQHYNTTSADILTNVKMNTRSKLSKRGQLKSALRWILLRCFTMGSVHLVYGDRALAILPCTLAVAWMGMHDALYGEEKKDN